MSRRFRCCAWEVLLRGLLSSSLVVDHSGCHMGNCGSRERLVSGVPCGVAWIASNLITRGFQACVILAASSLGNASFESGDLDIGWPRLPLCGSMMGLSDLGRDRGAISQVYFCPPLCGYWGFGGHSGLCWALPLRVIDSR